MTAMDINQVLGLRLKAETVEGVCEALEEVRAAGAAARQRLAELEAARAETLLSGSASAVTAAEAALTEARGAAERAGVLEPALERKLAELERAREVDRVKGLAADANAQQQAVTDTLIKRYPILAKALIDEVLAPEKRASETLGVAYRARQAAIDAGLIGKDEVPLPKNGARKAAVAAMGTELPEFYSPYGLYEEVHLPGVAGLGGDTLWGAVRRR
jgi:hypothetical protein